VTTLRGITDTIAVAVVSEDKRLLPRVRAAFEREGMAAYVEDGGGAHLDVDRLERWPEVVLLMAGDPAAYAAEVHRIRRKLSDDALIEGARGRLERDASALQAMREALFASLRTVHVVVVLSAGMQHRARHVLDAGVDGVVLEPELEATLALVVRSVCSGHLSVPRSLRYSVELPSFSHRERQILRLVVAGMTNEQIARRLYLARSTVAGHLTGIFRRLGVRSRSEAVTLIESADESLRRSILGGASAGAERPAGRG
jgi:DNA-binding NarL/FixJ family response regulator